MLADDRPDYPRSFAIVLQLSFALEEPRLRRAVNAATKRHPLLRALVDEPGERATLWVECPEPRYAVEWQAFTGGQSDHYEQVLEPFDLCSEPGVRFRVEQGDEGDVLRVDFHHACTDGIGAVQFLSDLLTVYSDESDDPGSELPPLDPSRLAHRADFGLTGWRLPIRWLYGSVGWLGAIEFLVHRPAALGRQEATVASSGRRASGYCWRTLTVEQTTALVQVARSEGVTVNDLLMRDIFVAIQQFVERHDPDRLKEYKRIMVPTSLRVRGDELMPAADIVAMINLDRRPHRWTDEARMLRVLHWELSIVKRLRLGVIFVQIIHTLWRLFGSLRRFLPADRCQATCVASNLGHVLPTIGADQVRAVEFYSPIRPLTAAAFGIATHAGRMTVSLHYDRAALSADQGAELLDRLVDTLRGDDVVPSHESAAVEAKSGAA
jgi:hypothetical protein